MKTKKISLSIFAVLAALLVVITLIPFIYVSKFAYPWADDFSYGTNAHVVFNSTGSVLGTVEAALKTVKETYFDWQGTYTSCFLMALQPAVWNIKAYHLTGSIMVGTMLLAYLSLGFVLFKKILRMPWQIAVSIILLVYFASIQMVSGIAEGFTWFNSSVHYTFMHSIFVFFYSGVLSFVCDAIRNDKLMNERKTIIRAVFLCVLAIIVAGGNNVTILGGLLAMLLTEGALLFYYVVYTSKQKKEVFSAAEHLLPVTIAYFCGFLINVLAPGNRGRMAVSVGNRKNDLSAVIINAFKVAFVDIKGKITTELLMLFLVVAVVAWYSFARCESLERVAFSFPLPGLFVLASYCFIAALYCPMLLVTDLQEEFRYVYYGATNMARTENVIFFFMVLLGVIDIIYVLGWIYQKGVRFSANVLSLVTLLAAIVACVIIVRGNLVENKRTYLSAAAIRDLQNQNAQYYGYQMAVNTQRLISKDSDVLVMPIAVDPKTLYPYDASDWKEGARDYYQKKSVEYESGPYRFER